jgi:hypothetical protein
MKTQAFGNVSSGTSSKLEILEQNITEEDNTFYHRERIYKE